VLIRTAGRHAVLLELADLDEAHRWYAALRARRDAGDLPASVELVPGARTVLVDGLGGGPDDRSGDPEAVRTRLAAWTPAPVADAERVGTVEVPVRYDGADLADIAVRWDMTVEEAVTAHTGTQFSVAFCGFSPGVAYLAGLPARLAVPRRASPRTRVPAGSVALADGWCGVYPQASPGGWALVGTTDVELFDLDRDPPALLTPGTRVRFVRVDA
jgi:KipI family sensor histidine kinase inhibitor